MRLLLDSQAFLWWQSADARLSRKAKRAIAEEQNAVMFLVASGWELAIKREAGKLIGHESLLDNIESELDRQDIEVLPITLAFSLRAAALPAHHKDPFDRMLIAQAQAENVAIVSNDGVFDLYGIRRIW